MSETAALPLLPRTPAGFVIVAIASVIWLVYLPAWTLVTLVFCGVLYKLAVTILHRRRQAQPIGFFVGLFALVGLMTAGLVASHYVPPSAATRSDRIDLRPVLAAGKSALTASANALDGPLDDYPERIRQPLLTFNQRIAAAKAKATDPYDLAALKAMKDAAEGLGMVMLDVQFRNRMDAGDRLLHDMTQASNSLKSAEALMR
jgi:hypothetical protein